MTENPPIVVFAADALPFLYAAIMGALNRARGSQIYGLAQSTVEARVVAMLFMACFTMGIAGSIIVAPVIFAGLMLWCSFAWDNYWSAAIGNPTDLDKPTFPPVDFIMRIAFRWLRPRPRLWGALAMSLRGFIAGYALFVALGFMGYTKAPFLGLGLLLQGVPYYAFGHLPGGKYTIFLSEFAVGALMLAPIFYGIFFMGYL